ncbi:hypothetical protein [Streptomyces sp. VB1]|uniref:hypothetical protein n=1 Tax=Streptomyces sp. VB1 TaxID=2986803 RepID=UPI0022419370|nr:hypothetical protein [Streptomyces sp. VB1]UZI30693.1 hypothetical protein OH133_22765 [Streptomyces sp. VB1]
MNWKCAKCGRAVIPAGEESISEATRHHSREVVHQWVGVRRVLPNGTTQQWLTPSERADRADRARTSRLRAPLSAQTELRPVASTRRTRALKKNGGKAPGFVHTALVCVAGFAILIGLAAMEGFDDESAHNPSELPAAVPDVHDDSPSTSYLPPPTPSIPVETDVPEDPAEPGNGSSTAVERPREARESDDNYDGNYDNDVRRDEHGSGDEYYDGNYDNDNEWHNKYGNADEYYDGNYDNDDDYHRKYGRN